MRNNKLRIICAALGSAGLLTHFAVGAQTATTPAVKAEKIEVTGSNIKRVDAETTSVVQVLTKQDIERSGVATVADLLDHLGTLSPGHAAALADRDAIRIAVDEDFVGTDAAIAGAREIAIFPPVTGG